MAQNKPVRAPALGAGTSRLLQNYPMEPIGSRPSYVGELISLVRDGTEEIKYLLEAECDLRFNCKVCGSILPTARAFVIHKRQFCTSKYVDYQRKNVAIMERMSNLVSFEDRSFQTDNLDALELLNPINASLLIPLPVGPVHTNGYGFPNQHHNRARSSTSKSEDNEEVSDDSQEVEVPLGVEVVVPARPPVDGVYRFGMGSANLLANRKKKYRTNSMAPPKKKKPKPVLFSFTEEKNGMPPAALPKAPSEKVIRAGSNDAADEALTMPPVSMEESGENMGSQSEEESRGAASAVVERSLLPSQGQGRTDSPVKRSRRLAGVPHNAVEDVNGVGYSGSDKNNPNDPKTASEQSERMKDIRDPRFVRSLLEQLAEVADYGTKTCKECNRVVVSIYNLDRHVATQHLGLRECEYSLISKELRRLRQEVYGPLKQDDAQDTNDSSRLSREVSQTDDQPPPSETQESTDTATDNNDESSLQEPLNDASAAVEEHHAQNGLFSDAPTVSKTPSTDSETIAERLAAITRNPQTFKDILTTKDKEPIQVDYSLEELVQIHFQILEAADPFLQCCRLCNKQFFDVYVLNRHVMTVHLRLPERSCGTINKLIKEQMKRHPHAFAAEARKEALERPTPAATANEPADME